MAAFILAIALMFQTCCPKTLIAARRDRNRAAAAQQQLANIVGDDGMSLLRVSARRLATVQFAAVSLLTMSIERIFAWDRRLRISVLLCLASGNRGRWLERSASQACWVYWPP